MTAINNDRFKLSTNWSRILIKTFFYDTKQYIDFTSVGVGTHTFNYQPITVNITGKVGIASIGTDTFQCRVQPIIRGSIIQFMYLKMVLDMDLLKLLILIDNLILH